MKPVNQLALSTYGMHTADQIALVCVPLVAALVFDASADIIGVLVACQSMAHLLGSLPFGLIVDRFSPKPVVLAATLVSLFGFAATTGAVLIKSLAGFGAAVSLAGFGIVLFVLAVLSILPRIVAPDRLAAANAIVELPRAISSFVIPLLIGAVISAATGQFVFVAATLAALFAVIVASRLPEFPASEGTREGIGKQLLAGGLFVMRHDMLLPISLCAIFWNFAFAVLLVVMVPLIVEFYRFDPGVFGLALSAFGFAAILGSWIAGRFSEQVRPNVILVFGPASSFAAIGGLALLPPGGPVVAIYIAFFLLGFGPAMWLIAQNSVRQLVTPANMLGRVNAVIQTAIYGIRPLGALIGGVVVSATSPGTGLLVAVFAFALSLASALFSRLRGIRRYADLKPAVGQI